MNYKLWVTLALMTGLFAMDVMNHTDDNTNFEKGQEELVQKAFLNWQRDTPFAAATLMLMMNGRTKIIRGLLAVICGTIWNVVSPMALD